MTCLKKWGGQSAVWGVVEAIRLASARMGVEEADALKQFINRQQKLWLEWQRGVCGYEI